MNVRRLARFHDGYAIVDDQRVACPIHWPSMVAFDVAIEALQAGDVDMGPYTHCHGAGGNDGRFADALSRLSEGHCPGAACSNRLIRGDDGWAHCFVQDIYFQVRHGCKCDFPEGTTPTAIYFRFGT